LLCFQLISNQHKIQLFYTRIEWLPTKMFFCAFLQVLQAFEQIAHETAQKRKNITYKFVLESHSISGGRLGFFKKG
jgi:hypothetical protein